LPARSAPAPRPVRGAPPQPGEIVILAVLFDSAVPTVSQYGDALAGKIIVDITNPFNPSVTGLAVPDDTSIAKLVAEAAPRSAHVVKAFNTLFRDVLAAGGPLDVFMAGDDDRAKAAMAELVKSLGLRPLDVGGLNMAHWLEGTGLILMGLARHGVGHWVRRWRRLDGKRLARLLQSYGMHETHRDQRIGTAVKKGYRREYFEDAWSRYLPPGATRATRATDGSDDDE
jgi:hypothetical protein